MNNTMVQLSQIGTSIKKLCEDKDVKKHWLQVFNEKFNDIVESTMKAYSEYYKRKLGEVQGQHTSILIDSNSFKELLDLFGAEFPDDPNFKRGEALHLHVQGMDSDYGSRLSVLEAICGVKTLVQKTNDDFDVKVKYRPEDKSILTNAKDLQDFFEKVLVCLRHEFHGYENSDVQDSEKQLLLAQVEKTLAKQRHRVWDVCLLKLAKASLKNDTLEVFGEVLILLEYAEKPEAKSILSKDNANFKMEVVTHLKVVESSINDFLWGRAADDKLIYKHLIDLFTYLAKAQ